MQEQMTKKRRGGLATGLEIGRNDTADDLKNLAASDPEGFARKTTDLIERGELTWSDIHSLPRLFDQLVDVKVPVRMEVAGHQRALESSAFPLICGGLTIAGFISAYDAVPTIGEQLVTETQDNKKVSTYAAALSEDTNVDRVEEGKDFPEVGAGEEKVEIRHKRNGRRISITGETLEENDVAGFAMKVNQLGEIAAEYVEEQTLSRVCDVSGSGSSPAEPYVYRPAGSGTQLYNATGDYPGTRAPSGTRLNTNTLVDETDLDNARAVLAAMENSRGKRINIPMSQCILLVPDALVGTALKIRNSELTPGVINEYNAWGPRGPWQPQVVSSPKLDDFSTTAWYLGDFKRQFIRKWKLRMEYVTLGMDTETFLKSRVAFQARIAWDMEVGALDYVYVVQSLDSSTEPS